MLGKPITIGDKVIVVNKGKVYSTYTGMANELGATKWDENSRFYGGNIDGKIGIVRNIAKTSDCHTLVDLGEREIVIALSGLQKASEKQPDIEIDWFGYGFLDETAPIEPKIEEPMAEYKIIELSSAQEEILGDDDKALVQAGLVNDKLSATKEGIETLVEMLFKANRKELAEVARKRNAEEKKQEAKKLKKA